MFSISGVAMRLQLVLLLGVTAADDRDDRGDVPGWVLITVMTAGLVTVIWGLADETLSSMLRDALSKVKG